MQETIYRFPKNSREEVRLGLETYRGYTCIDIRCFVAAADGEGDPVPTPKGLKVRIEQFPELKRGIERLGKELENTGLLKASPKRGRKAK
jgi:hypothetical protein